MPVQEAPVTEGTLRTPEGQVLPLEGTEVRAKVVGPAAEVEVKQRFRNPTDRALEAVYLFPLPHEASVFRMEFRIGERTVKAVVQEKEEARRTYEAARAQGRAASLLEQDRPNLFTLSVANIPPGAGIDVTLAYHDRLEYDDGEWRLVFPMVAAERYVAPSEEPAAGKVAPPRASTREERPGDVDLEVDLHPEGPVDPPASPSHRVEVRSSDGSYQVRLAPGDRVPNRDFVLAWRGTREGVRPQVWFEREAGRPGTFMLLVTPPARPLPEALEGPVAGPAVRCGNCGGPLEESSQVQDVPGIGQAWRCGFCGVFVPVKGVEGPRTAPPRDVVFLVDHSDSMRGASVPAAARAVSAMLEALREDDGVQVFAFNHDVNPADDKGTEWLPNSEATRSRLARFLEGLKPRGGTELEAALRRGAALPRREGRARLVVLVGDAAVGNEGALLRQLPEILGTGTRLYVLGVGPAVNRYLAAKLARMGGGACDVLLPGQDPEQVVPRFARRVREAAPVLTGLALQWEEAGPVDVFPSPLPDLFSGQPLQVTGRFVGAGPSRLVLLATTADGRPFRQEIGVALPEEAHDLPGLERLWARQRVESLLDRLARRPEQASDIRLEVLSLALRHSLMSPYTSLVAEDSEVTATPGEEPRRVEVPLARPDDGVAPEEPKARGGPPTGSLGPARTRSSRTEAGGAAFARDLGVEDADEREEILLDRLASFAVPAAPRLDLAGPPGGAPDDEAMYDRAGPPPPPPPSPMPLSIRPEAAPRARPGLLEGALGAAAEAMEFVKPMFKRKVSSESGEAPRAPSEEQHPPLRPRSSQTWSKEEVAWARTRPIGDLDLVFLVDETGSMGPYIEQVKARLLDLIEAVRSSPLCRSLRLGLVTYRDHPPQDHSFVTRVQPLTEDYDAVRRAVQKMAASGGGDGPEAVTDGLHDLVALDWRPRAARLAVWVGDAPPHGVDLRGDGFPQGCPCGRHWHVQAESCREMGVTVYAVGCLPGIHGFLGAEEVFRMVADTTRGLYLPLSQAALLVPLIAGLADRELDRQRLEERVAEVVAEHEAALQKADEPERLRFLRDTLRARGVQALDLKDPESAATRFREVEEADVEAALDSLRRMERVGV